MGAIGTDIIYDNTPYPREISIPDDFRHTYICGMTGSGKSTLLKNLIDFSKGTCVIDFHGDLVEELLDFIPPERINDTIYFNPADTEFPLGFNPLQEGENTSLVAQGVIHSLKTLFDESWGPRLQYILNNTLLALLDHRHGTFLGINRMLSDEKFRKTIIGSNPKLKKRRSSYVKHPRKERNPVVMSFWHDEFSEWSERYRPEAIAPIQNKVGRFLSDPMMRNILGQAQLSFSIKDIIRRGQILLVNLSKPHIGEENARLLGGLLISQIHTAALTERTPYYLFVDEFQNAAVPAFESILSEARKFKLNLKWTLRRRH